MVVADDVQSRVFRLVNGHLEPDGPRIKDSSFSRSAIAGDRDGNVWIGTFGQGLLRVREGQIDRFTNRQGLSSNQINGIIEDREGDLWVATARGLDRIRDPKVQMYSSLNGLSSDVISAVLGAADGGVWIGTTGGLNRLDGEKVTRYSTGAGNKESWVNSFYEDGAGKLLVATAAGLVRLEGNALNEIRTTGGARLETVLSMAGNRSGAEWIADGKKGLFTVRGNLAEPVNFPGVKTSDIDSLLAARDGSVWIGHYGGGIDVLRKDPTKQYGIADGLGSGPVRALYEDGDRTIWAGTGQGLSRFRDSRWSSWGAAQGLPEGGVQAIVDDEAGGLWLLTPAGVVRVSKASLSGAVTPLQTVLYGRTEGLRLGSGMSGPRLTRSRDGRLWVCTEDGVAAIDPSRVQSNPIPPPVAIEQVLVDGRSYDPASPGEIAFRGRDLKITFTALSLMAPERVRFRYRLDGLNDDWTEAGSQRTVDYANLSPKHYRFRVIASNNDGLWNTTGAVMALRVDPYFYQTTWFLALCVASAAFAIWFAHRMRVRSEVGRVQLIAAERVRFGRELHDSLLQGFTGVVFLLEAVARQFEAAPELSKQRLNRALDQADQSMREARLMIVSMRISALDNQSLPEALRQATMQMMSEVPVDFQFEVKGRVHQGPYDVEANLFLIAREALSNALNHAAAKHIRLEMCYTPGRLDVTMQDDGAGFDTAVALAKAGHWGLRGMRERAGQIGATFHVNSSPGHGSIIRVGMVWKK
jgi:signal transduction histidine kinase/ligand-binding sensor domain-containing protein